MSLPIQAPEYYGATPPAYVGDYTSGMERISDICFEIRDLHEAEANTTEKWLSFPSEIDYRRYIALEHESRLVLFTLRHCGILVGNLSYILGPYANCVGVVSANDTGIYINPVHRVGSLAMKLMRYAEETLTSLGVHYIVHGDKSPVDGTDLGRFFGHLGYKPFAVQYVKEINELETPA